MDAGVWSYGKMQKHCDGDHVCIGYRRLSIALIKNLARTLEM